jgi:hypothetical protein
MSNEPKFFTGGVEDEEAFHAYWKGLTFDEKRSVRRKSNWERLTLVETAIKFGAWVDA